MMMMMMMMIMMKMRKRLHGVSIVAWRYLRCSFEHVKLKFFRVFNCIYAKSKAAGSEINTVELFKSYCLPHITYVCEALPFSKTDILRLDNLIVRAVCRIFNVRSRENIDCLRSHFNLPQLWWYNSEKKAKIYGPADCSGSFWTSVEVDDILSLFSSVITLHVLSFCVTIFTCIYIHFFKLFACMFLMCLCCHHGE